MIISFRYYRSSINFPGAVLSALIMLSVMVRSYAQEAPCLERLSDAEQLFQMGIFEDVSVLLEECLDSYEPAEKQRAYKLIVLSRYMNDDIVAAEETMHKLLKEFPSFVPADDDPVDFQFVYSTFRVKKLCDIGLVLGPELAWGTITEPWSPFSERFRYNPGFPGYAAGVRINFFITKNLLINTQPVFSSYKFRIHYATPVNGILQMDQKEQHMLIEIPLYVQAELFKSRIKPYFKAGGMIGYLLSSNINGNIERFDTAGDEIIFTTDNNTQDNKNFRNNLNYFVGGGIGMNIDLNKFRIFTELNWHHSVNEILKQGTNRFDQSSLWTVGWFDSDFRLNKVSLRIGITKSIYWIKKQK